MQRSIIAYRPSTLANQDFRPKGKPGKIQKLVKPANSRFKHMAIKLDRMQKASSLSPTDHSVSIEPQNRFESQDSLHQRLQKAIQAS